MLDIMMSADETASWLLTAQTESTSKEIKVSLANKIKIRGALKGSATQNCVSEQLKDETIPEDAFSFKDKIETIQQKIELPHKLNDEIIDLIASCDDEDIVGCIEPEFKVSNSVQTKLSAIEDRMEDELMQLSPLPPIQLQQMQTQEQSAVYARVYALPTQLPGSSLPLKTTVKLPKMEVKKSSRKLQE